MSRTRNIRTHITWHRIRLKIILIWVKILIPLMYTLTSYCMHRLTYASQSFNLYLYLTNIIILIDRKYQNFINYYEKLTKMYTSTGKSIPPGGISIICVWELEFPFSFKYERPCPAVDIIKVAHNDDIYVYVYA